MSAARQKRASVKVPNFLCFAGCPLTSTSFCLLEIPNKPDQLALAWKTPLLSILPTQLVRPGNTIGRPLGSNVTKMWVGSAPPLVVPQPRGLQPGILVFFPAARLAAPKWSWSDAEGPGSRDRETPGWVFPGPVQAFPFPLSAPPQGGKPGGKGCCPGAFGSNVLRLAWESDPPPPPSFFFLGEVSGSRGQLRASRSS